MRGAGALFSLLLLAACAPHVERPGPAVAEPVLRDYFFHAADGATLPYRVWLPEADPPRAAIIALHGFNDYGNFFAGAAAYFQKRGIASYAYDQRGFGATARPGLWPGSAALTGDLDAFVRLARGRHPGMPVYLLGESMGGAVILSAHANGRVPAADGVILSAPAVWGRATMPWYQRLALWLGAHVMPAATVTGQGLNIMPSDNIEMLRALGRDPLVIKETRVDAVHGLVDLMDEALDAAAGFRTDALILYGRKDEIIPKAPTKTMLERLPATTRPRIAFYDEGYHMLLRDLQAEVVWRDIAAWIENRGAPLPSGADKVPADIALGE